MRAWLGGDSGPFLGMLVLFGTAALLTGRAMAETWRPAWQIVPAALALAVADRFLLFALYAATALAAGGFAVAAAVLGIVMAASYYRARARKMVRQYPWLYQPKGPFGWRSRPDPGPDRS